jgi:poly(A) polymerase
MTPLWSIIRATNALSVLLRLSEQPVYLVGGAVRDVLLGAETVSDWDLLVPRGAIALARRFADATGGGFVTLAAEHEARPTARVVLDDARYDIAQFRGASLDADLRARDLTINAMAVDLRAAFAGDDAPLIDPCGGAADLAARQLRPCGPAVFADDPLRALRLYRFVATLGFVPTADAEAQARAVAARLATVAPERIVDELARLLGAPGAAPAVERLARSGLWEAIVPEARAGRGMAQSRNHHLDVFDHNIAAAVAVAEFLRTLDDWAVPHADNFRAWLDTPVAGERTRRWVLPFAALLHDAAKPETRSAEPDGQPAFHAHERAGGRLAARVAVRLRLSRAEHHLLVAAVRWHAQPIDLQQHGPDHPLRLMAALRDAAPGAIMVAMGDRATARGPNRPPVKVAGDVAFLQGLVRDFFGVYTPLFATPPLITGDDLIHDLGMRPGRAIGHALLMVRWRQLTGDVTDRASALRVATHLRDAR